MKKSLLLGFCVLFLLVSTTFAASTTTKSTGLFGSANVGFVSINGNLYQFVEVLVTKSNVGVVVIVKLFANASDPGTLIFSGQPLSAFSVASDLSSATLNANISSAPPSIGAFTISLTWQTNVFVDTDSTVITKNIPAGSSQFSIRTMKHLNGFGGQGQVSGTIGSSSVGGFGELNQNAVIEIDQTK